MVSVLTNRRAVRVLKKKHLGYYIKVLSQAYQNFRNIDLKEFDLTNQQFEILMYLYRNEDKMTNQTDIENLLDVTSATASGILKRLELMGYIKRSVSSTDSRCKKIENKPKGKEFKEIKKKRMDNNEHALLEGISSEEEHLLIELLQRIIKNVKKEK